MKYSARFNVWMSGLLLAFFTLVVVGACSTIVAPKSFDQQLAYAIGQVTAARQTAADLVERGRMTADEGQQVLDLTDQARVAIEAARFIHPQDEDQAVALLRATQSVLLELESIMRERQ